MSVFHILGETQQSTIIVLCFYEQLRQILLSISINLYSVGFSVSFAKKWPVGMSFRGVLFTVIL